MSRDPHADHAAEILTEIGYTVERILETTDETADLWAHSGSDRLTIEVKSRVDDLDVVKELAAAPGTVVTRETPLVRSDPLGRMIRKARSQIRASQSGYPGLGVLWFRPDPVLGVSNAIEQVKANLLGSRWVSYRLDGQFGFAPAFLVAPTDFHRFPDLDAAVLQKQDELQLVVNPFSARKDPLRATRLHHYFDAGGAVIDLDRLASGKDHFILRCELDRADKPAVLAALAHQHPGHAFTFSNMQAFSGITTINRSDLD
jgi:hypothetical protein